MRTLIGHTYWVNSAAFSPSCEYLASGSDYDVKIWNPKKWTIIENIIDKMVGILNQLHLVRVVNFLLSIVIRVLVFGIQQID